MAVISRRILLAEILSRQLKFMPRFGGGLLPRPTTTDIKKYLNFHGLAEKYNIY